MTIARIMSDLPSPNCPLSLSILAMTFYASLTNDVVSDMYNPLFALLGRLWPILEVVLDDNVIQASIANRRWLRYSTEPYFDLFSLGADKLGISHQTLLFKSGVKIVYGSVHVCLRLCTSANKLSGSEEQDDRFWVCHSVY